MKNLFKIAFTGLLASALTLAFQAHAQDNVKPNPPSKEKAEIKTGARQVKAGTKEVGKGVSTTAKGVAHKTKKVAKTVAKDTKKAARDVKNEVKK